MKEVTTIELSDFQISQLNTGYSVRVGNILLTFNKGSKRYCKVKSE